MPPAKRPQFSKQFSELEDITKWFERDDVDLEEGIVKFERGMALAKEITKRLRDAEVTIEKIRGGLQDDAE